MATPYNHRVIEKKWRENWEKNPVNVNDGKKPKYYCLDMFPYPSGNGLHVGHWRGYVISDVWSRYKMLNGYYVIHPMGWDAFGLPAENYAIKMGVHPEKSTAENIANIKRQIQDIAAVYDWDMEVNTTDPKFYKWTQWIFVKMFKAGLAYEKEMPINWCPSCKTGLANEEVVNGKCERCGADVTKKNLKQWMLKITKYADRLLSDLDKLDWPEKVKKMQTDWIGKSYGAEIDFAVDGRDEKITVYTTRPDTLYGATFMVLAPEHKLAKALASEAQKEAVEDYIYKTSLKSSVDRLQDKEKTGVFTGSYAINPLNGAKVPIWLSDYVLADYGTGAIMCVPAHDDRDFEFATKFNIPIIQVISPDGRENPNLTQAYTESGIVINSGEWTGMDSAVLKKEAPEMIEKRGIGKKTVNYKLRDWVFSRQRYWGERSRSFTVKNADVCRCRRKNCRCCFLKWKAISRQVPENHRWPIFLNGSIRLAHAAADRLSVRQIQCLSGQVLHGISCAMWTIKTTRNLYPEKRLKNICRWICISAVLSMRYCICFTQDFTPNSFMTSV